MSTGNNGIGCLLRILESILLLVLLPSESSYSWRNVACRVWTWRIPGLGIWSKLALTKSSIKSCTDYMSTETSNPDSSNWLGQKYQEVVSLWSHHCKQICLVWLLRDGFLFHSNMSYAARQKLAEISMPGLCYRREVMTLSFWSALPMTHLLH